MYYRDQLVLTGEISDTGEDLVRNVPRSYRAGVELETSWTVFPWLTARAQASFGRSGSLHYVDHIDGSVFYRGTTRIAFSPDCTSSLRFDFHYKGFEALWQTIFVGKQYLTNGEYDDLSLNSYTVTSLNLA